MIDLYVEENICKTYTQMANEGIVANYSTQYRVTISLNLILTNKRMVWISARDREVSAQTIKESIINRGIFELIIKKYLSY